MVGWLVLLVAGRLQACDDIAALCANRAAIERVYYNHRLGEKPPFDQALPLSLIERLVKADLHQQIVLEQVYGVVINAAVVEAEVRRINSTTRAPETLAELKAALGNDPERFARTVARPLVVERLLRNKFENDNKLHAAQRQQAETVRAKLLKAAAELRNSQASEALPENYQVQNAKPESQPNPPISVNSALVAKLVSVLTNSPVGSFSEATWQLEARRKESNAPDADLIEVQKRFGPNAQIISSPPTAVRDRKLYFEDLPPALQKVLRAQLRQAGDVSAVIETPGGFLLYLAREKNVDTFSVTVLSLAKRSYDDWLAEQTNGSK